MTLSWQHMIYKPSKLCHNDQSSVGQCMQDYQSLRLAIIICASATLVNTQTHRQTSFDRLCTISSAS